MTTYGLYNKADGTIAETPIFETFMWLVSETPECEICECGVYEEDENGKRIAHQTLNEWLFDFIGREPTKNMAHEVHKQLLNVEEHLSKALGFSSTSIPPTLEKEDFKKLEEAFHTISGIRQKCWKKI